MEANRLLESLEERVGLELGISNWLTIDQPMIDAFADSTRDHQWIHIDVERANTESVFKSTVAHGFLILSLMPYLRKDIQFIPDGVLQVVNYGADYLRFLHPVRPHSRIRLHIQLNAVEQRGENRILLKSRNTVEIEGEETPALIADMLTLLVL